MSKSAAAADKEKRVVACLQYISANPLCPIQKAAREFDLSRSMVRRRLEGVTPRQKRRAHNAKLSEAEEDGILRELARLAAAAEAAGAAGAGGGGPPTPTPKKWVTETANAIILRRAAESGATPVLVRPRWVDAFLARHQLAVHDGKIIVPTGRREPPDPENSGI
ncbi:hypothetical protein IF1G_08205 [Cordyceps javanica]|uniref:HTH CENPB-type domain-containing protein n=1 Tax=Cordyceps javanica TaxID=43265 RepID=A0A545UTV5_9HYPO|nr:hypothetical protein IF1G_08205 [Cordyceps javanica]TQW04800.1 hypothetical protein IF2G_07443 [Cordyceps javanica]